MSGKRHHVIPRFVQLGFTGGAGSDKTWVYRKGAAPFSTNITNVGVESQFYTEGENTAADDLITGAEDSLSAVVKSLRAGDATVLSNPLLPLLIAHLEFRSRHLRQSLLQSTEFLMARFLDLMEDDELFAALLIRRFEKNPSSFREPFAEELEKLGLPQQVRERFMQLGDSLYPLFVQRQRPEFSRLASMLRPIMANTLTNAVKSGHIKALTKSLAPPPRIESYARLTYAVVSVSGTRCILGDSAVVFEVNGPRHFTAFLENEETLRAVYLPLEPGKVLVGAESSLPGVPALLPEAIARCSLEYFIAAEDSETNRTFARHIGTAAELLRQSDLEKIINEIYNE